MNYSNVITVRHRISIVLLIFALFSPFSESRAGWIWPDSITDAPEIIEKAIRELLSSSTSWQEALRHTIDKLTEEGHDIVAHDLSRVLQDTTADIGIESRCFVDFLRRRVIEDLRRIKSKFGGGNFTPTPAFCNPNPTVIDALGVREGRVLSLDVSGYNLNLASLKRANRIEVKHIQGNRQQDVTRHLSNPSPYLLTLNLGRNGVQINSKSNRLEFYLDGIEQSVTVSQPPPDTDAITPPDLLNICPTRYGNGDREFKGHGPTITAEAKLTFDRKTVWVNYYFDAYESYSDMSRRHDHTAARAEGKVAIYNVSPNREIIDVEPREISRIQYVDNNHQEDIRAGGRLVRLFETNGDTKGKDVGNCKGYQDAYISIYFNTVYVTHREKF